MFALAWKWFSDHRVAMGLVALSACTGLVAASNLLNPEKKVRIRELLQGRERFEITSIGAALDFLTILLIISSACAGWFGL